jgi:large subunit ribosomal protein L17
MRHQKKFNHLGRKSAHRKAMLSNMAASLIIHKRIHTTVAKAKALRIYVEPLITKSKEDTTHSRRTVFSYLQSKEAVTELFREISKKIMERPGGYTRILKTGNRFGDNAEMCLIELVDYNEAMLTVKDDGKGKSTRRRRAGSKKKAGDEPEVKVTPKTEVEAKPQKEVKKEVEPVREAEADATSETPEEKPEV